MYKKIKASAIKFAEAFFIKLRGGSIDHYLAAVSAAVFKGQSAGGAIRKCLP